MHMADSLLSPAVGGVMWAATAGLAAYAVKTLPDDPDHRSVPTMGVMGAFVFAAQMLNFAIPGTGSSGHLGGGLLLAAMLGPGRGFLTLASVLLVQALFFADGGLLAYGANVFNLGFFTCFLAYPLVFRPLVRTRDGGRRLLAASVAAAVVGLQLGALGVVVETYVSGTTALSFGTFLLLMQPIHLAIGIVEGLATAAVVEYVWKTRPDLLPDAAAAAPSPARSRVPVLAVLAAVALAAGCFLSWFASPEPDGLEWSIEHAGGDAETGADAAEAAGLRQTLARIQERTALMPDYAFREEEESPAETEAAWPAVDAGTSVAGLVGCVLTLALALLAGRIAGRLRLARRP